MTKAAAWLGLGLAVTTAAAGIIARFAALEESKGHQVTRLAELSTEHRRLKERVEALERDRELLERLHRVENRLTAIEERVRSR